MFLKRHVRRKDGKQHAYYSLTESTRVSRHRTVQRRVATLMAELGAHTRFQAGVRAALLVTRPGS